MSKKKLKNKTIDNEKLCDYKRLCFDSRLGLEQNKN